MVGQKDNNGKLPIVQGLSQRIVAAKIAPAEFL